MPVFPEPKFPFSYSVATEVQRLRAHKASRGVPTRTANRLLVATWNIANLGAQKRRDEDRRLLAEIISWFDLVAIQELRDNFADLDDIRRNLGEPYKLLFSDVAGNDERMAFVYDSQKLTLLEKVGEIGIPPSQLRHITIKGIKRKFDGFDRNPYLAAFQAGQTSFMFVNVHLFFGSETRAEPLRKDGERPGRDMPVVKRGHHVLDRPDLGWGQSMGRRVRTGRLILKCTRVLQASPGMESTRTVRLPWAKA